MTTATIQPDGHVTIPPRVLAAAGLHSGDTVEVASPDHGRIALEVGQVQTSASTSMTLVELFDALSAAVPELDDVDLDFGEVRQRMENAHA